MSVNQGNTAGQINEPPQKENDTDENQNGSGQAAPDIARIMAEIRARVHDDVEENRDQRQPFRPFAADDNRTGKRQAGELLHSEDLKYLNSHYAYGSSLDPAQITTHRPGLLGKLIVRVKRKVLGILWHSLLHEYFQREKQFQAHMIRFLNDVSKYVDERDASNFWELIRKLDVDVTRALDRIERINDEQSATMRASERRVFDALNRTATELSGSLDVVKSTLAQDADRLRTLESVTDGLEGILARSGRSGELPRAEEANGQQADTDYSYLMLENRFRGSEEAIAERLSIYPPFFSGSTLPVLEIGPGRGELLAMLRENKVAAYGVDMDAAMVEAASERKLDSRLGDGLAHLESLEANSLGGVIAIQVVEHLTRQQLERLFELCASRVAAGGKVIFETINPRSMLALSSNYFRDPTHVFPLHPDTLRYMMTLGGLEVLEVTDLSPVPDEAQLKQVPLETYMTPRWKYTVDTLNHNIDQLNSLLYGFQDFCIVAQVREER